MAQKTVCRLIFLAAVMLQIFTTGCATPSLSGRSTLFNADWKFIHADPSGAQLPTFVDANWRNLKLPHDWSIEGPYDEKLASCPVYLPGGIGWYRKSFTLSNGDRDKSIS